MSATRACQGGPGSNFSPSVATWILDMATSFCRFPCRILFAASPAISQVDSAASAERLEGQRSQRSQRRGLRRGRGRFGFCRRRVEAPGWRQSRDRGHSARPDGLLGEAGWRSPGSIGRINRIWERRDGTLQTRLEARAHFSRLGKKPQES